ncbi:MAG TPA: hypothetical protein DCR17_00190 [Verrucomicrobiales bacterium]|nr:hypothetical protein [Verrucomicrobiales bacterium]HAW01448.1 hypothetical protein [Verrucomicrobiales bacterium]
MTGGNPSRSKDRLLSALMFLAEEDKERVLKNHERTIASLLQKSSYTTAMIGKWHLGHGRESFFPITTDLIMLMGTLRVVLVIQIWSESRLKMEVFIKEVVVCLLLVSRMKYAYSIVLQSNFAFLEQISNGLFEYFFTDPKMTPDELGAAFIV